jgi:hypothetical protein
LWLGPWAQGEYGWAWRSDIPRDLGAADGAGFDVAGRSVDAWSRWTLTAARISRPGLVGSLVPGYTELRELASHASQQTFSTVLGCRIDFAFVSAVTFTMQFNTRAPILGVFGGKEIKQLVQQRGYGESKSFELGVEFSDGWRPCRARLIGEHVPIEREAGPLQFAIWLARRVAHDRLHGSPYITDQDRAPLERALGTDGVVALREGRTSSSHWKSLRVDLPGHRPVSVELAS